MVDPGTFGKTKACIDLADRLNNIADDYERTKLIQKTSMLLGEVSTTYKDLMRLTPKVRRHITLIYLKDVQRRAESSLKGAMEKAGIPYTYINNIILHKHRQSLEYSGIIDRLSYGDDEEHIDYKAVLEKLSDIDRRREYYKLDDSKKNHE